MTAAWGLAIALARDPSDLALSSAAERLRAARPTAVNLAWAVDRVSELVAGLPVGQRAEAARREAAAMAEADVAACRAIGEHGADLIEAIQRRKAGKRVDILTHCNAGWLAAVDWGTALAPIYVARERGVDLHVWVDETRPRNQGAALTAFELGQQGVDHTIIVDNAGGHLMQQGRVDLCLVGADRITRSGDVANKIGTYLKALAAKDNQLPFYVAAPSSTVDWRIRDGVKEIPIEERAARGHPSDRSDQGRRRGRGAGRRPRKPGGEPCLRCHAIAADQRARHRTRRVRGERGGDTGFVSRAVGRLSDAGRAHWQARHSS